jgi:hypothetical protein
MGPTSGISSRDPLQFLHQIPSRLPSMIRIFGQTSCDKPIHCGRHRRDRRWFGMQDGAD